MHFSLSDECMTIPPLMHIHSGAGDVQPIVG
jgi:hypothetical protein